MKRLAILGCTGSVGTATLEAIRPHGRRFRVVALTAGRNLELLRRQVAEWRPEFVAVAEPADAAALMAEFPTTQIASGAEGIEAAVCRADVDTVVVSLVGAVALAPTMAALGAGKDVALANKECLVMAGELVTAEAARTGTSVVPVDSEHSGLHQILGAGPTDDVARLVLTASGGPFRTWSRERMVRATVAEALAHPTWRMGPKISVDSATMMNKGLEIIEAHYLFGMPEDQIDVVIHPQSLVHALVVLKDGTLLAQLAANDMRIPILYALGYPKRLTPPVATLEPSRIGRLDFSAPDHDRFPTLGMARAALRAGGEMPVVLNAVNEVAVAVFLAGRCRFGHIADTICRVMDDWSDRARPMTSVDEILALDADARRRACEVLGNTDAPSLVRRS